MDLRFLVFGAVLPDLLDTPVGLLNYRSLESTRLVGHSLFFAAAVMIAVLLTTRRGRPRKRWMPLAIGVLLHLLLDAMWADQETFLWPFLGWGFSPTAEATAGGYVVRVLADWRVWALELAGLGYLAALARRADLGDTGKRKRLIMEGTVDAPIGSA